ncbi:hypothetical protein [Streptomyces clavifer]|uniref:hypothetical protein n=1 Tax=Streptomyces clavifer TaxID=68188 RepID=UPI0036A5DCD1
MVLTPAARSQSPAHTGAVRGVRMSWALLSSAHPAVDTVAVVYVMRCAFKRHHLLAEARRYLSYFLYGRPHQPGLDERIVQALVDDYTRPVGRGFTMTAYLYALYPRATENQAVLHPLIPNRMLPRSAPARQIYDAEASGEEEEVQMSAFEAVTKMPYGFSAARTRSAAVVTVRGRWRTAAGPQAAAGVAGHRVPGAASFGTGAQGAVHKPADGPLRGEQLLAAAGAVGNDDD